MKKIYNLILTLLISGQVYSQCTVNALSYIWPDTTNINFCFQLGDTLVIDATNNQVATQLDNDFELGTFGSGWQTGLSATIVLNNPAHCAWPPPANPVPNNAYAWMGNAAAHPRNLESIDFDLTNCYNLEFDMKYATQSQGAPCEGPDLFCEGVRIQYSTDAGVTWYNWDGSQEQPWSPPGSGLPDALTGNCSTHPVYNYIGLGYWDPDTLNVGGSASSPFVNWFHVNTALPMAARTSQTRIRWIQLSSSANSFDHWGLDNVKIGCQAYAPGDYTWTGGAAVDTIPPHLPNGGLHLISPDILGTYEWVVTFVDSSVMAQGAPGPDICHDTVVFVGIASFNYHVNNVSCYGLDDGMITIEQLNASSSIYSFYINGVLNTNPIPYDTVFDNLSAGIYNISISDNGQCQIDDSIIVNEPNFPLQISSLADSIYLCYNTPTGSAIATAVGGTPSYSYEWFDGSYTSIGNSDSISGLSGGSYFVKVTDANGCDTATTLQVLQMQTPLVGNNQIFGVSCKGDSTGMIVSQAIGSQYPYRYYWFSPNGDSILKSNTDQFLVSRDTLKNLASGTYDLHIYDANACFESYTITVGEPSVALSIDSVIVSSSVTCYGDNTGAAQTFYSGGMPNYYLSWDNGELGSNATQLNSGYHIVTLSDDWGCEIFDSVYVPENPEIISTIIVDNEVSCCGLSDGSVSVTSIGGVPNYTYFWSNGWTQIGSSSINSGLTYGSYYLTTQDIYGCEVFDSIFVGQPDPLFVEASEIDSISCYGYDDGLAYAYAGGGTGPYTFYWDSLTGYSGDTNNMLSPGVHTVYVVDSRGCQAMDTVFTHEPPVFEVDILDQYTILPYCIGVSSASLTSLANGGTPPYWYQWDDNPVTPQTTPVATNLLAGVYTITVTDSRGCMVYETRDIDTITNTMTSSVYTDITYNGGYHVSCYGEDDGMLYVIAGGSDHLPFTYQWYGPNGFSSVNDSIMDLVAGTYSVTVLDSNLCASNTSFDITTPDALEYTILGVIRDESCEGSCNGQLSIDLSGGSAPYVGISTNTSNSNMITSTMIGDSILGDMCSGTWDVELTDANNCNSSIMPGGVGQFSLGYNNQTIAQINLSTIVNVLCYGTSTGSLDVLNPSTNPNYTYDWENVNSPGTSVGTGSSVINLPAGHYVLMSQYSDSLNFGLPYSGCTSFDTIEITQIDEIDINSTITNVDCYDQNTGGISVLVSGGTSSYTLQWNPGSASGSNLNNITEGTYTLSVTDANGCLKVDTFIVTEPPLLVVNLTQNGATLNATVNGGVPGYTYRWKEFSSPNNILQQGGTSYMVLTPGSYYLEIEDNNGCITLSDTITFIENTSVDILSLVDVSIYPNPFKESTTIDFGMLVPKAELRVVDIVGNIVDIYEVEDQRSLIIYKETKSKGVYFIELIIDGNKLFKKITIQ